VIAVILYSLVIMGGAALSYQIGRNRELRERLRQYEGGEENAKTPTGTSGSRGKDAKEDYENCGAPHLHHPSCQCASETKN
jgi:NADH:ubiquinone oxidoreductase subunit 3 (subunit A)